MSRKGLRARYLLDGGPVRPVVGLFTRPPREKMGGMASVLGVDLDHLGGVGLLVVVAALVFTESGVLVGLLLPGDTILFGAGLLTARPGLLNPFLLAGTVAVAAAAAAACSAGSPDGGSDRRCSRSG